MTALVVLQRRRITRRQDGTENDRPNVILDTFADLEVGYSFIPSAIYFCRKCA